MASLLSLANETILQIIDETRPDGIWSLVRCCRRIWHLGADELEQHRQDVGRYRAPSFRLWEDQFQINSGTYELLTDILRKPRRALYVNRLSVSSGGTTHRLSTLGLTKKMSDMLDEICKLFFMTGDCPYIQPDEVGRWVEELEHGFPSAVICLILTLLPNLQTLTISDYNDQLYAESIYRISKTNQSPYCMISGPLPLNRLETVTINDTRSMSQISGRLGIYEACMTLPALRRLNGKYINSAFDRWPSKEEFSSESKVTEIIFDRSAINTNAFRRLLARTENLQRFTYTFVRLLGIYGDYTAMGLKQVLEKYSARTLTYLDLDFNGHAGEDHGRFIGSLSRLQSLKHLRIQANMFIDDGTGDGDLPRLVDLLPLLPPSIETLTLLPPVYDVLVTYTLGELRKKREECLPHLREFRCGTPISITSELKDECTSLGIDLVCF